ncbi:hypothetical protein [uncultured Treponema sp.]|uniref:hypothetical protein n=1 Tax=uncultured Treponema sp. TaxID=162155 RepID=UPI0027D9C9EB|nr:hypothetical protein [uncultured Treponema sp.]
MYYLFIGTKKQLEVYKKDFERVKNSINKGKTPVFSELRSARTNLIESIPYNILQGCLLIAGTYLLQNLKLNETAKIGIVLVLNNFLGCLSNFIFVRIKHLLRLKLCERLNLPKTEETFAVMESLEYQSV